MKKNVFAENDENLRQSVSEKATDRKTETYIKRQTVVNKGKGESIVEVKREISEEKKLENDKRQS